MSSLSQRALDLILGVAQLGASSPAALAEKAYRRADSSLKDVTEAEFKRLAYYAKAQGYIETRHGRVFLTSRGSAKQSKRQLQNYSPPLSWDGLWRVIIFDIPESKRLARDAIRRLIKNLGFVYIQGSVWLYPHDCTEHIKKIESSYDVGGRIRMIVAQSLDGQEDYESQFRARGILR